MLPPGFRFEVTSPRLACVFVLLITLGWYEVLMPRLSVWREQRRDLLRERRRIAALEAAKWRKEATRRCRNCLTAYKDQNPAGGRFMCTYCGHVSRRPVLDISNVAIHGNSDGIAASGAPLPASIAQSGIGDLGGKSLRLWNGKELTDRANWTGGKSWMGGQLWASGSRLGGSWLGLTSYWGHNVMSYKGICGGGEQCSVDQSDSSAVNCLLRVLGFSVFCTRWVWKKLFNGASSAEDGALNASLKAGSKKAEDGFNSQGNKGEKAKRKAEEKRQARLEKEMLEEEERKQREEVARLVEERRRLRDEKLEAEKVNEREVAPELERENRREREAERRRQEKVKEREKSYGKDKSYPDGEEAKKKNYKENERKSELDKKGETERRDVQKTISHHSIENCKIIEGGINSGAKISDSQSLDNTKGSYIYPSKSSGLHSSKVTSFWGKSLQTASSLGMKSGKPVNSGESTQMSISHGSQSLHSKQSTNSPWNRMAWAKVWGKGSGITSKDVSKPQVIAATNMGNIHSGSAEVGKTGMNGMGKNTGTTFPQPPVIVDLQTASKATNQTKSWQQLFTSTSGSSSAPSSPDTGIQLGCQRPAETGTKPATSEAHLLGSSPNSICFGSSAPVTLNPTSAPSVFSNSVVVSVSAAESINSPGTYPLPDSMPLVNSVTEKTDIFEDPSYVPDPVSLLGPITESLDTFPLDLGTGLSSDTVRSGIPSAAYGPISAPISKPASTECPLSELLPSAIVDEVHCAGDQHPSITQMWDLPSLSLDGSNRASEQGQWQMWDTPQVGQCEIGVLGEPSNWILSNGNGISDQYKDLVRPLPLRTGRPLFKSEDHLPCVFPQQTSHIIPNQSLGSVSTSNSLWLNQPAFEPVAASWDESCYHQSQPSFANGSMEETETVAYDSHSKQSPTSFWFKSLEEANKVENNCSMERSGTPTWSTTANVLTRPHIGGIYTTPDVQSVWSYK